MSANARRKPSSATQSVTARRPGRVDEHAAVGEEHQLARGRGVPAALVAWRAPRRSPARRCRRARSRASTSRRPTRRSARPCARGRRSARSSSMPTTRDRARDDHGRARRACARRAATSIGPVDEVGLRQHDHRVGAALEREHELALEPAQVRAVVERLRDEHRVDVGGDDLRVARECRPSDRRARTPNDGAAPRRPRRRRRRRPRAPSRRSRPARARSRRGPCRRR